MIVKGIESSILTLSMFSVCDYHGRSGRDRCRISFTGAAMKMLIAVGLCITALVGFGSGAEWKPVAGRLMTRWARDVNPDRVHPEYPRPHLVRDHWINLNGLWEYAITDKVDDRPGVFQGKILVPFAIESSLSGVGQTVGPERQLWYRRSFSVQPPPGAKRGGRWLLHFGAVDWQTTVWINGIEVGSHQGGYDPFTFDITDAMGQKDEHELLVRVWDPTDAGVQPRGKQVRNPHGIWYTSVTGIWQTVWMEYVPAVSIENVHVVPDVDQQRLVVSVSLRGDAGGTAPPVLSVEVLDGQTVVSRAEGPTDQPLSLPIPQVKLWSPTSPFLYGLRVKLYQNRQEIDAITSYAAMRKIALGRDSSGLLRLFLNNQPLFQFGLLDQGWWPDGLYTAPTDEALQYDLEVTKKLGFNLIRKHVKVEPARWYYHCDRLGLLVWQDMPNGDRHIGPRDPDLDRSAESEAIYRREWQAIIEARRHHPCIVAWVPFNEGWGQFKTNEILAWTKQLDPTRLVDGPSGWTDRGTGDMHDMHRYPGPAMPQPESHRAVVLGEFGGLGLPVRGHLWNEQGNWGYRTFQAQEELQQSYELLIRRLKPLIARGLAAAVYTQTTDVEIEVNGLMTYDRAVIKLDPERTSKLHQELYQPQKRLLLTALCATSEAAGQTYRYTTEAPPAGWYQPEFDDGSWKEGTGGFGEPTTPGSVVRTTWKTNDIWLRRSFRLDRIPEGKIYLRVHHDEDTEIYLNGRRLATLTGYTTEYEELELADEARNALRQGENILALHCRQTGGGQYIDVGLFVAAEE